MISQLRPEPEKPWTSTPIQEIPILAKEAPLPLAPRRQVTRKAPAQVTPSVIRSVQHSPDAKFLGAGQANANADAMRADSVLHLSPSLQNIVDEAILGPDDRLKPPRFRDANGPGETTIKYNNALAEVRLALVMTLVKLIFVDRFRQL